LLDERLSSHAASARLDSAGRATRALGIDAMAAAVILETYFNGLGAGQ
jgi:RNase H-fold protein (predicted Holliday junction resolvase)